MKTQSLRTIGCWAAAGAIAACGGGGSASPPPASGGEKAPPAGSAKAAEAAPASDAGAAAPAPVPEAKTETTAPAKKDEPKPSRPPHDVLVQKDTLFMLNFDESDAGKAAEASCSKSTKDPKSLATCIGKERAKIDADGHGFKKDKEDHL